MSTFIQNFADRPITFEYPVPHPEIADELREEQGLTLLESTDELVLDQTYFKAGHDGTSPLTFTRKSVAVRIEKALELLLPEFGLIVFDAYRSIKTQRSLLRMMTDEVSRRHPQWTKEQIHQEACKFVVNPDDRGNFPVAPHNSGGAIDLAFQKNGKLLDFGSEFDAPTAASSMAYFEAEYSAELASILRPGFSREAWLEARKLRRVLFHTMISLGFTNYQDEWWHYDLGDCMWARQFGFSYVYEALEPEVEKAEQPFR